MPKRKRKGQGYKKFLQEENALIPSSTVYFRKSYRKKEVISSNNDDSSSYSSTDINEDSDASSITSIDQPEIEDIQERSNENLSDADENLSNSNYDERNFLVIDANEMSDSCSNLSSDENSTLDLLENDENIANDIYDEYNDQHFVVHIEEASTDVNSKESALYKGCNLSKAESELLIMTHALRHHLSEKALDDTLHLIDCHLPEAVYHSKYRFLKSFEDVPCIECFYCSECPANLDFPEAAMLLECEYCKKIYNKDELKKAGKYFYYLPLINQFIDLVNSELYLQFRKESNENDIMNGEVYKDLRNKHIIKEHDFTIQWNTDGVQLFESSKSGIWPILITVNELPYRIRKNNVLLCGLFYGDAKPPMNVYLKPFIKELTLLSNEGFQTTTYGKSDIITIKVHTILSSVDSVARPEIQNMKRFNGFYGCTYCYNPGVTVAVGRGFTRIYKSQRSQPRSHEKHKSDVVKAVEEEKIIYGVKGPSIVMEIPNFDIIYSFPPDYMHACLLGAVKLFVTEWFDGKNSDRPWYLGLKETEFNSRLLSIKPPAEITRVPRPIRGPKYKANEWKTFLLYYSLSILKNLLPNKYLSHWLLLVYSLYIFLKTKITETEFSVAEKALFEFADNIEPLYGTEFMKYNIHLLYHIPSHVKKYGALWAWSAFPFEHFNGIIQFLYHGTQSISQQICKSYMKIRNIKNSTEIFSDPNCSESGRNLFKKLMNQCRIYNCIEYGHNLRIFGNPTVNSLSLNEKLIVEELLQYEIHENVSNYHRFIYNGLLFHTTNYLHLKKRNNSVILTEEGNIAVINNLAEIERMGTDSYTYVILATEMQILNEELSRNNNFSSNEFSYIATISDTIICINPSSIKCKCVIVELPNDKVCITPIVNIEETD